VELLGENLVAFRDSEGKVGLLDELCPHRGASLALGINDGCGLRCLYHGWKMAVDGRVMETPSELETSTLRDRVRHLSYPVREAAGFVWAYMGPAGTEPEMPPFEWTGLPDDQALSTHAVMACNWAQAVEGVIDSAHISYLHSTNYGAPDGVPIPSIPDDERYGFASRTNDGHPRLEAENTSYGFAYAAVRTPLTDEDRQTHLRISHFASPFYGTFPCNDVLGDEYGNLQAFVPINDHETWNYYIVFRRTGLVEQNVEGWTDHRSMEANLLPGYKRKATRRNNLLQDRGAIKRGESSTGLGGIGDEDASVQESMGPIYDRTKEHLGTSDVAVIRFRHHAGGGEGARGDRRRTPRRARRRRYARDAEPRPAGARRPAVDGVRVRAGGGRCHRWVTRAVGWWWNPGRTPAWRRCSTTPGG
jgi:phthalate 4,5-dioxygenase oxygenase subunit